MGVNIMSTKASTVPEESLKTDLLNRVQKKIRRKKAEIKHEKLRDQLWPDVNEDLLWAPHTHDGYAQIPRTLPIFINIINDLSKTAHEKSKSIPAGKTYLVLWSRLFNHSFVTIQNEKAAAFEAGYSGERSVTTWREHLQVLKKLGFIDYRGGIAGDFTHILIFNPYKVAVALRDRIQSTSWTALYERALDIGADKDLVK